MSKTNEYKIMSIEELKPYQHNPRKNEKAVEAVANSIKTSGFRAPIIIDEGGEIIAGHTRYKAAKQLGLKKVPCIICHDIKENQKTAYRIADNKTGELARWDFSELDAEVEKIDWGEMAEEAETIDWGEMGKEIEWPELEELNMMVLGFTEHEAANMKIDAEVGALLDSFESESPVREREERRAAEKDDEKRNDEGAEDDDNEQEVVVFTARGKYEDFGEDFWKIANELYARGIKTETKGGRK